MSGLMDRIYRATSRYLGHESNRGSLSVFRRSNLFRSKTGPTFNSRSYGHSRLDCLLRLRSVDIAQAIPATWQKSAVQQGLPEP